MMLDAPQSSDEQDRADMLRLCAGQDDALNELMERHAPRLFNYLLRSLQNEDDAADLAQEAFARVFYNRAKFDQSHRFTVWLYAIASNLVRTQFRHRTRHPTVPLETVLESPALDLANSLREQTPTPAESIQTSETANAVRHAINQLPEELRTPLILSEYEELSQAEIGQILNCSSKAVETRLYRARKQLRSLLSGLLD